MTKILLRTLEILAILGAAFFIGYLIFLMCYFV